MGENVGELVGVIFAEKGNPSMEAMVPERATNVVMEEIPIKEKIQGTRWSGPRILPPPPRRYDSLVNHVRACLPWWRRHAHQKRSETKLVEAAGAMPSGSPCTHSRGVGDDSGSHERRVYAGRSRHQIEESHGLHRSMVPHPEGRRIGRSKGAFDPQLEKGKCLPSCTQVQFGEYFQDLSSPTQGHVGGLYRFKACIFASWFIAVLIKVLHTAGGGRLLPLCGGAFWACTLAICSGQDHQDLRKFGTPPRVSSFLLFRRYPSAWTFPNGSEAHRSTFTLVVSRSGTIGQYTPVPFRARAEFSSSWCGIGFRTRMRPIPVRKLKSYRKELGKLVTHDMVTCRGAAAILGQVKSPLIVVSALRSFFCLLQPFVQQASVHGWDTMLPVPMEVRGQLRLCRDILLQWPGRYMLGRASTRLFGSDTSTHAYGGLDLRRHHLVHGYWRHLTPWHITLKEVSAATDTIRAMAYTGDPVKILVDNTVALSYLTKQGGKKLGINRLMRPFLI